MNVTFSFSRQTVLVEHSTPSPDVTSSPRETLGTCEEQRPHPSTAAFFTFKGYQVTYCHLMVIDSRTMESAEEDALLGEESEEEHSELSDSEVSYCCHANISQPKLTTVKLSK